MKSSTSKNKTFIRDYRVIYHYKVRVVIFIVVRPLFDLQVIIPHESFSPRRGIT